MRKNRETLAVVLVSVIVAFIFLLNSPIHPWRCAPTGTDSSVFKTVAFMMDKGYVPYRDSFDHKGPLLYVINYWGQLVAYYRGVWVFEMAGMTLTFFMLYKIARLKASISSSVIIVLMALSMLFGFFEGGNFTEEYAMPFIAIGVYVFLDYLLNDNKSYVRIIMSGVSMGAVCLLRPNMIAIWVVFGMAILFIKIREKAWKELNVLAFYFLAGFFVAVVPFVIWLSMNGALSDCIKDYIVFNAQYCSASGGRAVFSAKWSSFFFWMSQSVYVMAFVGIFYNLKKDVFLNIVYVVYLLVNPLFLCMSGQVYGHYGMVLIPTVAYPLSLIAEDIESVSDKKMGNVTKMLVGIYLVSAVLVPVSLDTIKKIPTNYAHQGQNQFDQTTKDVCKVITRLTKADDGISVYGNRDIYYVWARRKHATKYSYQSPIGQVMPKIKEEYMQQLAEELPLVIVVQKGRYDKNISGFLKEHQYTKVWSEGDLDYQKSTLVFYRPKNL